MVKRKATPIRRLFTSRMRTAKRRRLLAAPRKKKVPLRRRVFRKTASKYNRIPIVMYHKLLRPKVRTWLTYCDTKQLSPGDSKDSLSFRLNSIYAPEYSAASTAGHQPAFHDKWSVLYNRYRVIAASWKIIFRPHRGAVVTSTTHTVGAEVDIEDVADTTHADMERNPGIVGWETNNTNATRYFEAGDNNVLREVPIQRPKQHGYRMTGSNPYRAYMLTGYTKISTVLRDPNATQSSVQFGSNPAQTAYLLVSALSKDGLVMSNYEFDIKIKFFCEFSIHTPENQN